MLTVPKGAIGVLDSGIGGLTVLNALMDVFPTAPFVYFGDTARVPYGTKNEITIKKYAHSMIHYLMQFQLSLLVIACNTICASALQDIQDHWSSLPIVGVIDPAIQEALMQTRNHRIALLATETTLHTQVYQKAIQKRSPNTYVEAQACGLFVALVEEACTDEPVTHAAARKYLYRMAHAHPPCDTLILGCTHFPLLHRAIASVFPYAIQLISSADATARYVHRHMQHIPSHSDVEPVFLVTDAPDRFQRVGSIFLKHPIKHVFWIDL